jgi:hypothetical protein
MVSLTREKILLPIKLSIDELLNTSVSPPQFNGKSQFIRLQIYQPFKYSNQKSHVFI